LAEQALDFDATADNRLPPAVVATRYLAGPVGQFQQMLEHYLSRRSNSRQPAAQMRMRVFQWLV